MRKVFLALFSLLLVVIAPITSPAKVEAQGETDSIYYYAKTLSTDNSTGNLSLRGSATVPYHFYKFTDATKVYSASTNLGDAVNDDEMVIVRYDGNLTINSGVTLTTLARKRGLVIYVVGNLVDNGTISMTGKGAYNVAGQTLLVMDANTSYTVSATACGSGGAGGTGTGGGAVGGAGTAGTSYGGGAGGGGGGGYSGGSYSTCSPAVGSAGGSNAGAGGAGGQGGTGKVGSGCTAISDNCGICGGLTCGPYSNQQCYYLTCTMTYGGGGGGGAGAGGGGAHAHNCTDGTSYPGNDGGAGSGGLLILIVDGSATFNSASLLSVGSAGGTGGVGTGGTGGQGGGSGGGTIQYFYGSISITGSLTANVYGGVGGGWGSTGTVNGYKVGVVPSAPTNVQASDGTDGGLANVAYVYGNRGGDVTFDSTYAYHTFRQNGIFVCGKAGNVEVLAVGGGGGGASPGSGGGSGGVQYSASLAIPADSLSVIVAEGGSKGGWYLSGSPGGQSWFYSLGATGGAGGIIIGGGNGAAGASGSGGALMTASTPTGGAGTAGQGYAGGAGYNGGGSWVGNSGGGGGAGGVGAAGGNTAGTGAGGSGNITFSALLATVGAGVNVGGTYYIAGGGGGGEINGSYAGAGGSGGGGSAVLDSTGGDGLTNTGGGGAGGGYVSSAPYYWSGGNGGSGIVIVKCILANFQIPDPGAVQITWTKSTGATKYQVTRDTSPLLKAVSFNGTSQAVEVAYNSAFYSSTWTWEAMIYRRAIKGMATADSEFVMSFSTNGAGASYDKWLYINNNPDQNPGTLVFGFYNNVGTPVYAIGMNTGYVSPKTPIPINAWSHVAIIYDGTYAWMYLNGILEGQSSNLSANTPRNNNYPLQIGRHGHNSTWYYGPNAYVDEVRLWNDARTVAEIQSNMSNVVGTDASLVGYWKMEDNVNDSSGNGRNGTAVGSPTYVTSNFCSVMLGDVASYSDVNAAPPTITAGTASATDGTYADKINLSVSGESGNNGTTHTYTLKAYNNAGYSADSSTDTGYRGYSPVVFAQSPSLAFVDNIRSVSVFGTSWRGQSFTPTRSGTAERVRLRMLKKGSPTSSYACAIRATTLSGGYAVPTGANLCSGNVTAPAGLNVLSFNGSDYDPGSWVDFDLGAGTSLTAGTQYAVILYSSAATSTDCLGWRFCDGTAYGYSGGSLVTSADSGSTWTASGTGVENWDFTFQVIAESADLKYSWRQDGGGGCMGDGCYEAYGGVSDPYSDRNNYFDPVYGDVSPLITSGSTVASDGTADRVSLSLSGTSVANGIYHSYVCDVSMLNATTATTAGCSGKRNATALSYQWYRSSADSNIPWWNASWSYMKPIVIAHPTDGAGPLTNYQMKLSVNENSTTPSGGVALSAHSQTDLDDLRFVASDNSTLCDYWIESIAGTTPNQNLTVWIEIPSIAAHPTDTTIYMYYGNASATAQYATPLLAGKATFPFFDDFSDPSTTLNTYNWSSSTSGINNNMSIGSYSDLKTLAVDAYGTSSGGAYGGSPADWSGMNLDDDATSYYSQLGYGENNVTWSFDSAPLLNSGLVTFYWKSCWPTGGGAPSVAYNLPICIIGGVTYDASTYTYFTSTYTLYSYVWTVNPATGNAWTSAEIDSATFGYKSRAYTPPGSDWACRSTYAYLTVGYNKVATVYPGVVVAGSYVLGSTAFGQGYSSRIRSSPSSLVTNASIRVGGWSDDLFLSNNSACILSGMYTGTDNISYHTYKATSASYRYHVPSTAAYHIYEVARVSTTSLIFSIDGAQSYNETDSAYVPTVDMRPVFGIWSQAVDRRLFVDWALVRKIVAVEPTWGSFGSEVSDPYGILTGATSSTYDDTTIGVGTANGRYYVNVLSSVGASNHPSFSSANRGYRMLISGGGASTYNVVIVGQPPNSSTFSSGTDNVTNTGTVSININISGTDAVGSSVNWTLSDTATPGADTYGLTAVGIAGTVIIKKTAPYNELFHNLMPGSFNTFTVKVYTPSSISDNSTKIGTISLIVTAH